MQVRIPAAKASATPLRSIPLGAGRGRHANAAITGSMPTVESAWLWAGSRASPIRFETIAQSPHETMAANVQINHRGMGTNLAERTDVANRKYGRSLGQKPQVPRQVRIPVHS